MTTPNSNQELYDQLMQINEKAFDEGNYEAAYHALAAALHCAIPLQVETLLIALEQRAREQRDWIDTTASQHRLSSQSAALHGHKSIYASLVRQIETSELLRRHHCSHPELDR